MSEIRMIENEKLQVRVSDLGAELYGILDKDTGREVLWQGDPKYWGRRSPLLFPFVGKCCRGYYVHEGKKYEMGKHGFAREMVFQAEDHTDTSITHKIVSTEETLKSYPFMFELKVTHSIEGKKLKVTWEVSNQGNSVMYFSIGGHPAFHVPAREGERKTDYFIDFYNKEEVESVPVDLETGSVFADRPQKILLQDHKLQITEHMFDQDALIFDEHQLDQVGLAFPDGTPYVTMYCKEIPSMAVWSMPDPKTPFICLEPWIGRCDNYGFDGELKDKYCVQSAEPGKTFRAQYEIEIH